MVTDVDISLREKGPRLFFSFTRMIEHNKKEKIMKSDLALGKLNLYKELDEGKFNMLNFGVFKETLRVYVREGDGTGKRGRNLINMPIMFINARAFVEELKTLNDKEAPYSVSFDMYGPKWDPATKKRLPNERTLMGKIGVARAESKTKDIINILFVVTDQNVKKVFPLIPTPYLDVYRNGKKVSDKRELSEMWTKAYAKSFESVLDALPEVNNERDDSDISGNGSFTKNKQTSDNIDDVLEDL